MQARRMIRNALATATGATARSPADELALVEVLADEGNLVEAVDLLARINRRQRDPGLEVELIDLRARAAARYDAGVGRTPWPPTYADPFPHIVGQIPEVPARNLTTDILGGAVAHHGCLIVRGVFSAARVARSVALIEHVRRHRERTGAIVQDGTGDLADAASYRPLATDRPVMDGALRQRTANAGGTWLADSPTGTAQILDDLDEAGVVSVISGHLGERPFFSLQKSTLRRSLPVYNLAGWHQDGSFLDRAVRTMNAWVALSRCGGDHPTPGLELVPKRIPEVLPVDGVLSPHSIDEKLVAEVAGDTGTVIPEFAPGDSIMFDERCLHRTHLGEGMTEIRYALECWFFAPSHQSPNYMPLLV